MKTQFPLTSIGLALALTAAGSVHAQTIDYGELESLFKEPVTTSATGKPQRQTEVPAIPRLGEMSKKPLARRGRKDSSRHHDWRRLSDSGGTAGPDRAGSGPAGGGGAGRAGGR